MVRIRAIIAMMCLAPVILVASGCVNSRLPAIDPTGRRIFLPNPNFTTLAQDGPLSRLLPRGGRNSGSSLPGPYQPALFNRNREHLSRFFRDNGSLLRGLHDGIGNQASRLANGIHGQGGSLFRHRDPIFDSGVRPSVVGNNSQFNAPAFTTPPAPPLCGPDGLAPNGSPCYPIGSPSQSSLAATVPGAASRVGSGLASNTGQCGNALSSQQAALARIAQLGPGVVLARPRILAQVGEEVVVVGGVQSTAGIGRTAEPVQWSLANNSVGTIIDTARTAAQRPRLFGLLHQASAASLTSSGGCGNCVRSVTASRCDVLARNPIDPTDDIYLSRGQTWVSLTSGSEGTSYVTLAAPNLEGRRQATAQIEWIDANWDCPRPVLTSMEGPGRLITKVCRNSDKRPLAGWIVRHTILDGPTARLGNASETRLDAATDANGHAAMDVYPVSTEPGTTRVGIQIIDPQRRDEPIGQCIGYVTWSSSEPVRELPALPPTPPATSQPPIGPPILPGDPPASTPPRQEPPIRNSPAPERAALAIKVRGPETTANIGNEIPYRVTVRNISDSVIANEVFVSTSPAQEPKLRFLGSSPAAEQDRTNNILAWPIRGLRPGDSNTINVFFEALDSGIARNVFYAIASNAPEVQDEGQTDIAGGLQMQISQPNPARVGELVPYFVRLNNLSSRPIDVRLKVDRWTSGLEPVVMENEAIPSAELGILYPDRLTIPPGPSDPIPIDFRAIRPGTQTFRVLAEGPGGITAEETGTVLISERPVQPPPASVQADLQFDVRGPTDGIRAGEEGRISLEIENAGDVPLTGVQVSVRCDEDLFFKNATPGFSRSDEGRLLTWSVDDIPTGFGPRIEVDAMALPNPIRDRARISVRIDTDQVDKEENFDVDIIEDSQDRRNAFRPELAVNTNSLQATINSHPRAVRIGEPIDYVITVQNNNQLSFRDLQVSMEVAEGMKFVGLAGPPAIRTTVSDNGLLVDFSSVREILPNESLTFRARVTASRRGVGKLLSHVTAIGVSQPLVVSSETTVN